jgi:hypothetical protein
MREIVEFCFYLKQKILFNINFLIRIVLLNNYLYSFCFKLVIFMQLLCHEMIFK